MEPEISGALAGAKALVEIAKIGLAARDDQRVKVAIFDLETRLHELATAALASVEKAAALQEALIVAQRENSEINARLQERGEYVLHEVIPGAFAYRSQQDNGAVHPAHYLCQVCYDSGVKAVLRQVPARDWYRASWDCPMAPAHGITDFAARS